MQLSDDSGETLQVCATFQPQFWCAALCASTEMRWRNSWVEYFACNYILSSIILDYAIISVSCYVATCMILFLLVFVAIHEH